MATKVMRGWRICVWAPRCCRSDQVSRQLACLCEVAVRQMQPVGVLTENVLREWVHGTQNMSHIQLNWPRKQPVHCNWSLWRSVLDLFLRSYRILTHKSDTELHKKLNTSTAEGRISVPVPQRTNPVDLRRHHDGHVSALLQHIMDVHIH